MTQWPFTIKIERNSVYGDSFVLTTLNLALEEYSTN